MSTFAWRWRPISVPHLLRQSASWIRICSLWLMSLSCNARPSSAWTSSATGCKNLFPDVSQWTWSARKGYCRQFWRIFAFNLLQLCIAGCVQWILVDLVSTFACHVFSFSFSISAWAVISSNAPKQLDTPEDTFQTSVLQFNFSTRLGWGFPPGTAAQEQIASMVTIGMRTQSWRTWWCLGKSVDLKWTWRARKGYCSQCWRIVAFNLLQLCSAGCVQRFSLDFGDHLRIAVFSLSVSLFPLELWYRPMLLSSRQRLKRRFRPQQFSSTFPLVLDEDSRRGQLHRRKSLPGWQLERGLSRDGLGDAWARAWIWFLCCACFSGLSKCFGSVSALGDRARYERAQTAHDLKGQRYPKHFQEEFANDC